MRRNAGFTLVELLAVVALTALLTATAAVSLSGAARSMRIEDAARSLAAFDRDARTLAQQSQRSQMLRFDTHAGTAERLASDGAPARKAYIGDTRIVRIETRAGAGEIPISALGQSPSYAVKLSGKEGEIWVLFPGLTGQFQVLTDERQVQDILAPTRADAR